MTDARVRVSTPDGDQEFSPAEYVREGGSGVTVSLLARDQSLLETGRLVEMCDHNTDVVERALQEDVFVGEARFKGWLVNDKQNAVDAWGEQHPGATLSGRFLIEDYSEKAWRLVAEEIGGMSGRWFGYRWVFLPKSQCRVTRVVGVDSEEVADDVSAEAHEAERAIRDAGWEAQLDTIESEPGDAADTYERSARDEREIGERGYQSAKGDALGHE